MPLVPYDWNVVLLGRWNRAILTPQGVASRLFQLPPNEQFGIEVPMDVIGPFKVSRHDLTVMVSGEQLIVEAKENDFSSLERAMRVAHRALENLPETPVFAAGFNVRVQGAGDDGAGGELGPLMHATQLLWDEKFERAGYPISRRDVTWITDWSSGTISVNLVREDHDKVLRVNLNFERTGDNKGLMEWLTRPIGDIRDQTRCIFEQVIEIRGEALAWLR